MLPRKRRSPGHEKELEHARRMEDKWFVYYEEPWLYLHRSWTGYCIYMVRLERTPLGARVAEAFANRDATQHQCTSDEMDADFLRQLLGLANS